MTPFVTSGAGFLLAVLWFDLMHDVQVLGHGGAELPETVLASIAAYYRRVTTDARPMNRLVAAVMALTVVAIVVQTVDRGGWVPWVSLALVGMAVGLAGVRTVPSAVRLGGRSDRSAEQGRLARTIFRDHCCCAAAIVALLSVQLAFAR
jgi:hypothetical protein